MSRIVVTRRIPEPAIELLGDGRRASGSTRDDRALTRDELLAAVAGADAVVAMLHDRVDGELLDAAGPQLRVVANVAVGYDNVDVAACTERGVRFTNTPGVLTDATADIAFALILMATRRLAEGERLIRAQRPWKWNPPTARHRHPGQDARHRRARADRPRDRAPRQGLRHGGRLRGPPSRRRVARAGARRALRRPRRAARDLRRRLAALPAHRRDAPPDRRRAAAPDEADRVPGQHHARPRGRRRRARGGAPRRRDRRRGARRVREASPRCTRICSRSTTSCCSRTSARRRSRRAPRWRCSPPRTPSPSSPAASRRLL